PKWYLCRGWRALGRGSLLPLALLPPLDFLDDRAGEEPHLRLARPVLTRATSSMFSDMSSWIEVENRRLEKNSISREAGKEPPDASARKRGATRRSVEGRHPGGAQGAEMWRSPWIKLAPRHPKIMLAGSM